MPLHPDGYWVPDLNPKQWEGFNCRKRYLLFSGPKLSGKTFLCLNKIVRHLWEINGARFAMFAKTVKSAREGGSYQTLTDEILPQWFSANLTSPKGARCEYIKAPWCDNATRTHKFRLRNYWNTMSEFYLFSLEHDHEIEQKVKNLAFSGFYFIELSNFEKRDVFNFTKPQLRMTPRIPYALHQWMADTNPAEDGEESWIYKLFYEKDPPEEGKDRPKMEEGEDDSDYRDQLHVIEFAIDDNPRLEKEQVTDLKQSYMSDPDLYDRYILGKWKAASRKGIFADVFLPATHVHGEAAGSNEANWQIIVPARSTWELISGWDLGDTNHSAHIGAKRLAGGNTCYDIIDEIVAIKEKVSIADFTDAFVERMDYWERFMRSEYNTDKILWRHWSDASSFTYKSAPGGSEERIVTAHSHGRINLLAVAKPRGSVRARAGLVRRLLFEGRLYFSAQLFFTLKMLRNLRRTANSLNFIDTHNPLKHPFDSLSYMLGGEEPIDITASLPAVAPARVIIAR